MMNDIEKLSEYFMQFPGIGRRQAKRFVYFLLSRDSGWRKSLSKTIDELGGHIDQCASCFRYFPRNGTEKCAVCVDSARDHSKIIVVEKDSDFEALHGAGIYDGMYFILGGLIPIKVRAGAEFARIQKLLSRIREEMKGGKLKEIIIGLSVNPDGEHTRIFLQTEIEKINNGEITVSILGRGLSTGTEVEYSDSETLKNALETRMEQ